MIPEFMYTPMYDEKHRFHVLNRDPAEKNTSLQKGLRENLLCGDCEGHFSRYERYASLVLSGRSDVSSRIRGKFVYLSGFQYASFKLFALSVLWRAGVSSLEIFKQVSLGPHEAKLRKMLRDDDPGPSDIYPFLMSPVVFKGENQKDLIMQPTWSRAHGHFTYRFVFGGLVWMYLVSSHRPPTAFRVAGLSEKGEAVMRVSEMEEVTFFMDFMKKLAEAGKLPEPVD